MSIIQDLLKKHYSFSGIGNLEPTETRFEWKDPLLSGKGVKDLVNLHLCKLQSEELALVSESLLDLSSCGYSVQDMLNSQYIALGYPLFYIKEAFGLKDIPFEISYALLYRGASVILEAERMKVKNAVLLIETRALTESEYLVFKKFTMLVCGVDAVNSLNKCSLKSKVNFYFGLFDENLGHTH